MSEIGAAEMKSLSNEFYQVSLSRSQFSDWQSALSTIRTQIEQSEIKIVDIKRVGNDELVIIYRLRHARER
ncbi:hypothetical protein [Alicyclobacillus cycloheptanicus]